MQSDMTTKEYVTSKCKQMPAQNTGISTSILNAKSLIPESAKSK